MPRARLASAAALLVGLVTACSSSPTEDGTLRVVTTVAPLTSIVANIAGPDVEVTGLVPEGTNSHTFEPKPSAAQTLAAPMWCSSTAWTSRTRPRSWPRPTWEATCRS